MISPIVLLARHGAKGDGNGGGGGNGTPAGTYEASVKGESGSLSALTSMTLVVQ